MIECLVKKTRLLASLMLTASGKLSSECAPEALVAALHFLSKAERACRVVPNCLLASLYELERYL